MKQLMRWWPAGGLMLVVVIAYGPVAFLHHPLTFDLITTAYPWRYFIGECLQNFTLPLWNPYQNLGYPIHADPQSGAWYPVVWIIGFFRGYDIYSQSFEFMLHVFLAGLGMQRLAKQLGIRTTAGFFASVAYACSGFLVGNAQHLPWIISATWIPFILAEYLRLSEELRYSSAIRLGFLIFLLLSGGYPAFFIILLYLLAIIFAWYLIRFLRQSKQDTLRFLKVNLLAMLATTAFSAVVIVSVYEALPYISRGAGTNLANALTGPFSPQSMLSFLVPFATVKDAAFFQTDLSMNNAYIGLVLLIFLIYGLFQKKSPLVNIFFAWAIFSLLAAMGEFLPLRQYLYDYAPGMNLFRMPSLFRLFSITGFIVVAAFGLDQCLQKDSGKNEGMRLLLLFFFIVPGMMAASLLFTHHMALIEIYHFEIFQASAYLGIKGALMVGMAIVSLVAALLFIALFVIKNKTGSLIALGLILCLDLALSARLNGPYTVYDDMRHSWSLHRIEKGFIPGFPKPMMTPVSFNNDSLSRLHAFYNNVSIFRKQIGWDGYNPFNLSAYDSLVFKHQDLFRDIVSNPPIYLSGKSAGDTCYFTSFEPNRMLIRTQSINGNMLNLLQNNYPGWQLRIDGKKSGIVTSNICLMSAEIPAGAHDIEFRYHPANVLVAFWLSVISMIVAGIWFLRRRIIGNGD